MNEYFTEKITLKIEIEIGATNTHDLGRAIRELNSLDEKEVGRVIQHYLEAKYVTNSRRLDQ